MKILRYFVGLLVIIGATVMWGVQASVALRECYLEHVEVQNANKYTGVLTSGLSSKKQVELNEFVIDSYPECDQQIAEEFYLPEFGLNLIAQAAQP